MFRLVMVFTFELFFFFNDTATTEIYTLSLHDALPISTERLTWPFVFPEFHLVELPAVLPTRLRSEEHTSDSSHANISYAVFCLKKKNKKKIINNNNKNKQKRRRKA